MSERPWCCPDHRCEPVHQLANEPLGAPCPGESFVCFGRMAEPVEFVYDGSSHANDLRTCNYTPLKGVIVWQENREDWRMLRDAYAAALRAVGESAA